MLFNNERWLAKRYNKSNQWMLFSNEPLLYRRRDSSKNRQKKLQDIQRVELLTTKVSFCHHLSLHVATTVHRRVDSFEKVALPVEPQPYFLQHHHYKLKCVVLVVNKGLWTIFVYMYARTFWPEEPRTFCHEDILTRHRWTPKVNIITCKLHIKLQIYAVAIWKVAAGVWWLLASN